MCEVGKCKVTDGGLHSWARHPVSISRGLGYNAFHFASAPDLLSSAVVRSAACRSPRSPRVDSVICRARLPLVRSSSNWTWRTIAFTVRTDRCIGAAVDVPSAVSGHSMGQRGKHLPPVASSRTRLHVAESVTSNPRRLGTCQAESRKQPKLLRQTNVSLHLRSWCFSIRVRASEHAGLCGVHHLTWPYGSRFASCTIRRLTMVVSCVLDTRLLRCREREHPSLGVAAAARGRGPVNSDGPHHSRLSP